MYLEIRHTLIVVVVRDERYRSKHRECGYTPENALPSILAGTWRFACWDSPKPLYGKAVNKWQIGHGISCCAFP